MIKKGDRIRLKPDADVNLSYKKGSPPTRVIRDEIWVVDAIEELDEGQNLNISTLGYTDYANPGSYCSWVMEHEIQKETPQK